MAWIKRNKFFVISMAVGLGCIGYCAYLFWSKLSDVSSKNDEYTSNLAQYKTLNSSPLYPSDQNITSAKEDQAKVQELLADYRKAFVSFPTPRKVDEQGFKAYLGQTVFDLDAAATNSGVTLPDAFAFGFSMQQKEFNYPAENLQPWMEQLAEIKAICAILYESRINSIESFQRVRVNQSSDDGSSQDCFDATMVTNSPLVSTPYKLTIRGFSRELANVLDGLAQSSNCFIVKTIQVEHVIGDTSIQPDLADAQPVPATPAYNTMPNPGGDGFQRRGERMREQPVPTPETPVVVPRRGPKTILSEGLLRITLAVDAVQISSEPPVAAAPAPTRQRTAGNAVPSSGGGH